MSRGPFSFQIFPDFLWKQPCRGVCVFVVMYFNTVNKGGALNSLQEETRQLAKWGFPCSGHVESNIQGVQERGLRLMRGFGQPVWIPVPIIHAVSRARREGMCVADWPFLFLFS